MAMVFLLGDDLGFRVITIKMIDWHIWYMILMASTGEGGEIQYMTKVHAAISGLSIDIKMLVNGVIEDELSIKIHR